MPDGRKKGTGLRRSAAAVFAVDACPLFARALASASRVKKGTFIPMYNAPEVGVRKDAFGRGSNQGKHWVANPGMVYWFVVAS